MQEAENYMKSKDMVLMSWRLVQNLPMSWRQVQNLPAEIKVQIMKSPQNIQIRAET